MEVRGHKAHVKAVHLKQKDHKCDLCGKGFAWPSKLRLHMQTVH